MEAERDEGEQDTIKTQPRGGGEAGLVVQVKWRPAVRAEEVMFRECTFVNNKEQSEASASPLSALANRSHLR